MKPTNRAFFPQDTLDRWLAEGRVTVDGEVMALVPDGPSFQLQSAVLFRAEVASGVDELGLCGKVKTLGAVADLAGEYVPGSVVLGDHAYEVLDGFVGEFMEGGSSGSVTKGGRWAQTLRQQAVEALHSLVRAG